MKTEKFFSDLWDNQADEYNKWETLGLDEKIEWIIKYYESVPTMKTAEGEKLFDAIRDYGDAKTDIGYFTKGNDQDRAHKRVDASWEIIREIIERNFLA